MKDKTELLTVDLSSLQQEESNHSAIYLRKYFKLFARKKSWIIFIALAVAVIWGTMFTLFHERFDVYTTSVVIRFDDPQSSRGISALTDFSAGMETSSKVAVLWTNKFLGRVVDSLNLNLLVKTYGISRSDLIKDLRLTSDSPAGDYQFVLGDGAMTVQFNPDQSDMESKQYKIAVKKNQPSVIFDQQGLYIDLNTEIIKNGQELELAVIPSRRAIQHLKDNLESKLDRTMTILTLSYTDRDPEFCATVTNTVSTLFIQQLWDYKRFQTSTILTSLNEQLQRAQQSLNEAETKMQEFRAENPYVLLGNEGERIIQDLAGNEARQTELQKSVEDLSVLLKRQSTATRGTSVNYYYQELLAFLISHQLAGASVFQDKYSQLISDRNRLLAESYTENHPVVNAIDQQMRDLQREIDNRAHQYLAKMQKDLATTKKLITTKNTVLRNLPGSELRLAELERNREIQERIVSSIMVRYNEARVSDAAIIPDAYIIDEAQPPLIESSLIKNAQMYGVGLLIGLALGIASVFFAGLFNHKLWTAEEIGQRLLIPVMGAIPIIEENNKNEETDSDSALDPKLITGDYAPSIAGESFRKLRTVIEMDERNHKKAMIVGSLNPEEGKSLISANLGIAYAQQKYNTVLVDTDLRRGVLHHTFGCEKKPGLTNLFAESDKFDGEKVFDLLQSTHIPNLYLLPAGMDIPNPTEIIGSPKMKAVYDYLAGHFDKIIFDTPPFKYCSDMFVLNMIVHNILMVFRYEQTNLDEIADHLREFSESKNDIRGVLINASKEVIREKHYQKYSYYSY